MPLSNSITAPFSALSRNRTTCNIGSEIMAQQTTLTTSDLAQLCESTLFEILNLKREISTHLAAVKKQRKQHPDADPYHITEKTIKTLAEDFLSIKEQGDKIAFDFFADASEKVASLLKKLQAPIQFRREDIFSDLETILDDLEQEVRKKAK